MSHEIGTIDKTNIDTVSKLANKPNQNGGYGKSGLTAGELKAQFDSYADAVAQKVNEILRAFASTKTTEKTDNDIAGNGNYIALDLKDNASDNDQVKLGESLADLVASFFSGAFAARLMVKLGEDEEAQSSLLAILNELRTNISGNTEALSSKLDKFKKTDGTYENQIVTDQIQDGAVTAAKIADKSVYTNKIAENAVNRMQLIESVRKNIDLAFAYVSYNPSLGQLMLMRSGAQAWLGDVPKQVFINLIPDGSITEKRIADGAVTLSKLSSTAKTMLDQAFSSVSYDAPTGKITFKRNNSQEHEIDLPLELIVTGGSYDAETKDITLNLANGTPITIHLDDIVDTLSGSIADVKNTKFDKFLNPETEKYESQIVTDQIKDGAVTADKLWYWAVTTDKIENYAITSNKIAHFAVDENAIGRKVVKSFHVGDEEIGYQHIRYESIGYNHLDEDLRNFVKSTPVAISENSKRIETLEGSTLATIEDSTIAYEKIVPADVGKYAVINKVGGKTTSIESRRRVNLFDESAITYASKLSGLIDSELGVVENGYLKAKYAKYANTVLWGPFKMHLTAGTYTISADMYLGSSATSKIMYLGLAKGYSTLTETVAITMSSYDVWERRSVTVTLTEDGDYYLEAEARGSAENYTNLDARFKNILVTRENIIEEPIATFEIPKAIRNREGYGSDGSYIDFDRKVFVNADGEEEDIAAELTSDEDFLFIEVLPLGTLRFVNEDGTETPVPSTITYQKKL